MNNVLKNNSNEVNLCGHKFNIEKVKRFLKDQGHVSYPDDYEFIRISDLYKQDNI